MVRLLFIIILGNSSTICHAELNKPKIVEGWFIADFPPENGQPASCLAIKTFPDNSKWEFNLYSLSNYPSPMLKLRIQNPNWLSLGSIGGSGKINVDLAFGGIDKSVTVNFSAAGASERFNTLPSLSYIFNAEEYKTLNPLFSSASGVTLTANGKVIGTYSLVGSTLAMRDIASCEADYAALKSDQETKDPFR